MNKLMAYVGKYKKYALLAPLTIIGEVILEVLIPMVMAMIIDVGIQGEGGVPYTVKMGLVMVGMAVLSLVCGALAGEICRPGKHRVRQEHPQSAVRQSAGLFL